MQEWEPWEADLAVPLSPAELALKVGAIFKHQSPTRLPFVFLLLSFGPAELAQKVDALPPS